MPIQIELMQNVKTFTQFYLRFIIWIKAALNLMTEIITSLKPLLIDTYTHICIYGKGINRQNHKTNNKVLSSIHYLKQNSFESNGWDIHKFETVADRYLYSHLHLWYKALIIWKYWDQWRR